MFLNLQMRYQNKATYAEIKVDDLITFFTTLFMVTKGSFSNFFLLKIKAGSKWIGM